MYGIAATAATVITFGSVLVQDIPTSLTFYDNDIDRYWRSQRPRETFADLARELDEIRWRTTYEAFGRALDLGRPTQRFLVSLRARRPAKNLGRRFVGSRGGIPGRREEASIGTRKRRARGRFSCNV